MQMMSVNRIGMNTCWAIRVEMMQFGSDNSYIQQAFIAFILKNRKWLFVAQMWKGLWFRIKTGNRTPGGSHDGIIMPEHILVAIENQQYAIQCKWCQSIELGWILAELIDLEWYSLVLTKVTNYRHLLLTFQCETGHHKFTACQHFASN